MALYPTFSACLSEYIRGKRNSLSPFRGCAVLDGAVGRLLASVAVRLWEVELDLSAMPIGALRASGRAGWLTCGTSRICPRCCWTARSCAHVSAAGAPQHKETDPALGRSRGGFGSKIHILADRRGRPLCLRLTGGQRHDSTQARALGRGLDRRAPVPPDRGPGLRQRRLPRLAGATGHRGRHSGPGPAPEPPAPRPGRVPGAQCRGAGHRLVQALAPRGHPLRQIRTSFLVFSVLGRGLDLDEGKDPHYLASPTMRAIR